MTRQFVGSLEEFAPGSVRVVYGAAPIAVWRLADGSVHATADLCTHYFWSLGEVGDLEGDVVTCAVHGAEFDVRTGAARCRPALMPLAVYDVEVTPDGGVYVDDTARPATARSPRD